MASRNTDGSHKLQPNVNKAVRHTGDRVVTGTSDGDSVLERDKDTSYIPSMDGSAQEED